MNDALRAAVVAHYDQAEAKVIDMVLARAAEHDGQDSPKAITDLARRLDASPVTRHQLALVLAALAIRLHRGGGR